MAHADIGAGIDPVGARGLRAQWVLQHQRGALPFVNEVVVRVPFEGAIKVPYRYNRLVDLTR
jgi:hypothetical protein